MGKLDGRVALITGAARGQGRAHALTLARAGADVAICDIADPVGTVPYELPSSADLEQTRRDVEALGRRCVAMAADVTRSADLQAFAERTLAELGRIDACVANAGILSGGVPSWELTEEQWDTLMAINLKGVWLTCKHVLPHMVERGSGSVVLTSSVSGVLGTPGISHYIAAKHGVLGLMKSLANEAGRFGVRVNAVMPGAVDNAMLNNPFSYSTFTGGAGATRADVDPAVEQMALLPGGWVTNEDVAEAVLWLVSDESRHVTGVALPVDAGLIVKV